MKNKMICKLGAMLLTGSMLAASLGVPAGAEEAEAATEAVSQEDGDSAEASEASVESMLEGKYFMYSFSVEGMGDFPNYVHFYGEVPGVGRVYYIGLVSNQMTYAGVYEVLEETHDYSCYDGRDAEEQETGTSDYTVVLYDFDGNELYRIGMNDGVLYNDTDLGEAMGASPVIYYEDTDPAGDNAETYEAEVGQKIADFVSPEDATCTVTLYHTGRYADLMTLYVEGDWGLESTADDGTKTYQLTPDLDSDTAATFVVSADGQSAVYTPEGGEAVDMVSTSAGESSEGDGQSAVFLAETEVTVGEDALEATVTLTVNPDWSCSVAIDVYGNTAEIDTGTYSMAEDGYTFQFVFENAGELSSVLDEETYDISLDYAQAGTDVGDVAATLVMQSE